jgi:large subunit ribosomal protein L21
MPSESEKLFQFDLGNRPTQTMIPVCFFTQRHDSTMYAIIEDGSRQYRAEEGKSLVIDHRECEIGQTLELSSVLLIEKDGQASIGLPKLAGAKVVVEVVDFPRVKVQSQLFRRRKNSKRLRGHTQPYVRVKVKQIVG